MSRCLSFCCHGPVLALLAGVLAVSPAGAADARVALLPGESWSDLLGGQEAKRSFQLRATAAWKGRVGWRFTADGRTLASGESPASAEPGKAATVEIRLPVP